MKKTIFISVLSLCLLFTACRNTPVEGDSSSVQQPSQSTQTEQPKATPTPSPEATPEATVSPKPTSETTGTDLNEEQCFTILTDTLSTYFVDAYLKEKAFMPVEGQVIHSENCYVFKMGTDTTDHFATEDWFAVSKTGTVYWMDIVMDEWIAFDEAFKEPTSQLPQEEIDNCIYMLNEYLTDEFAAEYYDMPDETKKAIFEEEDSREPIPAKLIGSTEEIPAGYYYDPLERIYYPVYNFDSLNSVAEHFSAYFTAYAMEEIEVHLSEEFLEFEDALYLVRGGRGYGALTLDFDSIDYTCLQEENVVFVDTLLFDEPYATYKLTVAFEDGQWKIDTFEEILM